MVVGEFLPRAEIVVGPQENKTIVNPLKKDTAAIYPTCSMAYAPQGTTTLFSATSIFMHNPIFVVNWLPCPTRAFSSFHVMPYEA